MEIGAGWHPNDFRSAEAHERLSREAARLGYKSIWTFQTVHDPFLLCALHWAGSAQAVEGGLLTGTGVVPLAGYAPSTVAMAAGTLTQLTKGKFVLGLGTGRTQPEARKALGIGEISPVKLMRDYVTTILGLLAGKNVEIETEAFAFKQGRLIMEPPPHTPVFVAGLGPMMMRLAGELADGAIVNWCTPETVVKQRQLIAEGAMRANRDPATIPVAEFIRVSVDDDVQLARRALAREVMGYTIGMRSGSAAGVNRQHFDRQGFADDLAPIDRMRDKGAPDSEILDAFPDKVLNGVGYFGTAKGAAGKLRELAKDIDIPIVQVVPARPTVDSALATLGACAPTS